MKFKSPIISSTELLSILDNENLIILDCTIDKVGKSLKDETLELIPNSRFFDLENRFSDHKSAFPHTLVSPQFFTREAQLLGINNESILVCYDRWGVYSSPRAWWMFKTMGFNDVYVLNGGLNAWKEENKATKSFYAPAEYLGNFVANLNENWLANVNDVLDSLENKDIKVIDARSNERFYGLVDEPRAGLRKGHIPNALNVPFEEVLKNSHYRSDEELKNILGENSEKEELIFTCGSGITASILALANHQIHPRQISKVYDGSWAEWGKDEELPIE
ncbi:sulfurtransferase [Faecalibacter rhinopitheci]|uniref:Sulfurtransferase n=1 Tax=Faecalibacter rhinopitheci TaxID=2779678 RepID=A0A8J7FN10_9FLAO|nr:sulfurtransferase [Faecalibacter rhinopitheci]MBF0595914.1 sulfurtransferase [Faecalibacter rhinopitheci]